MIKRLIRIEKSLTPKQAVLLWLRQERQGKTMREYARWLVQLPPYAAPRTRLGRQVESAIRVAMNGQDPVRIQRAVRQGQMQAEFLILLVNRTNSAILDDSRSRGLQIALLLERLRSASLWNEETANDWLLSCESLQRSSLRFKLRAKGSGTSTLTGRAFF